MKHTNHQDPEFKHLREISIWLHDYKCFICNKGLRPLEVHHIDKNSTNHTLLNLVPVCKPCHLYLGKTKAIQGLTKNYVADLLQRKLHLYK